MSEKRKLRKTVNKAFKKNTANDNARFKFTLSDEQKRRALNPPSDNTVDILHGIPVADPFRPLEKLDAPETAAWVDRQNKKFDDFMIPAKDFETKAMEFFDNAKPQGMRETMPSKYGDKYIVYRKGENDERWSLYIKDVPDYDAPARLLLDPMKIDPSGKTDIADISITRDGKIVAYALSVSGSDKSTLRFMDITTGEDLDLTYTKFRSDIRWNPDNSGFYYNHNDEATKSNDVRYHKMGTRPEEDEIIYSPNAPETRAGFFRLSKDSTDEFGSHEWISITNTDPGKNTLMIRPIGSKDDFREIFPHKEGTLSPIHEVNGKIYAATSLGAPNEKLVRIDVNNPAPDNWKTILPENTNDLLTDAFIWQNRIFATYSHDTGQILKVFDLEGKYLHDAPIPPLSTFSLGRIETDETTCFLSYNNFQEAGNVYQYDIIANTLTLYKKSTTPIDLKDCIVERVQAKSKDGTLVPMTIIRHPDTKLDGTAATLLYGYGGFNIPLNPGFDSSIAHWVRSGGIYVQANLRGGGEYGQNWYEAGTKEKKQNVFDDFIACSEHLIKNKYTSNKRLAIEGGSNGGLLTLAVGLQRPDLFGAIVSEVPVADMFRFHIGSYYGYGWKSDYGDPDIKKDFNAAAKYSPLHNVKPGFKHPPLLIKTDAHDDRVLPWHSYKMAATLQSLENQHSLSLLKVKTDGGHSAGMTEKQWYADIASVHAFLDKTLGPINQDDYKASLKKPGAKKLKKKTPSNDNR